MANNSAVLSAATHQHHQQQLQQQQFPPPNSAHHCKECGLFFDSGKSLEVHLQYHKENLLNKWATQAQSSSTEENNNAAQLKNGGPTSKVPGPIAAPADSSDGTHTKNKSPDSYGSRATPDPTTASFGHPPTPQSYHSVPSPYQAQHGDPQTGFSPGYQGYQAPMKNERASPAQYGGNGYATYQTDQYFGVESLGAYDYQTPKTHPYRYHPYGGYERSPQVTSSSPAYPSQNPQPTPSPSPKQCDKCGCVCDSAAQLLEHLNHAHAPNAFGYGLEAKHNNGEEPQTEILDLDSHKVHHVFQPPEEEDEMKRNGHPHSVSSMLGQWAPQPQAAPSPKMFSPATPFGLPPPPPTEHKMFVPHEFAGQPTSAPPPGDISYRPFEHLPPQPTAPVISSSAGPTGQVVPKGANWKSNEARRPKTYNCSACNKWFTSSGHLKRHYNTTLHKNAVKSSGQPDPATMPISVHHHPGREERGERQRPDSSQNHSPDSAEESRLQDGVSDGGYQHQPQQQGNVTPNGDVGAGIQEHLSRGLLPMGGQMGVGPPGMMDPGLHQQQQFGLFAGQQMEVQQQFQQATTGQMAPHAMPTSYPNGSAPHVTPPTVISSPTPVSVTSQTITGDQFGELYHLMGQQEGDHRPLPSFAQFHRFGIVLAPSGYHTLQQQPADVGGSGPATDPTFSATTAEGGYAHPPSPDDYIVTTLDPAEMAYSPPDEPTGLRMESPPTAQPVVAVKLEPKNDYEHGSPQITSTGSPKTTTATGNANGIHKCFDCDKVFNKACYLTQHNKTFHSGDKPFKCHRCGKRFPSEPSYHEHLAKHAGDKPYKCELCPKQFNHKTDLRRHMCLHTGQKPYACDHCGKGFIRKDHMLKHAETHQRKAVAHHVKLQQAAVGS